VADIRVADIRAPLVGVADNRPAAEAADNRPPAAAADSCPEAADSCQEVAEVGTRREGEVEVGTRQEAEVVDRSSGGLPEVVSA